MVKRVRLSFAKGLEVEFIDRDRAIKQVYELGGKGTRYPMVVFGPEGCGKTSWLLQAVEILKELRFDVVYFNPLMRRFDVEVGIEGLKQKALEIIKQVAAEHELARLVWLVIDFANEALKHRRRKLAIIVDDTFHLIGSRCKECIGYANSNNQQHYPCNQPQEVQALSTFSTTLLPIATWILPGF